MVESKSNPVLVGLKEGRNPAHLPTEVWERIAPIRRAFLQAGDSDASRCCRALQEAFDVLAQSLDPRVLASYAEPSPPEGETGGTPNVSGAESQEWKRLRAEAATLEAKIQQRQEAFRGHDQYEPTNKVTDDDHDLLQSYREVREQLRELKRLALPPPMDPVDVRDRVLREPVQKELLSLAVALGWLPAYMDSEGGRKWLAELLEARVSYWGEDAGGAKPEITIQALPEPPAELRTPKKPGPQSNAERHRKIVSIADHYPGWDKKENPAHARALARALDEQEIPADPRKRPHFEKWVERYKESPELFCRAIKNSKKALRTVRNA